MWEGIGDALRRLHQSGESVPDLEYDLTEEEALTWPITVHVNGLCRQRTLQWLARNKPLQLERLMDETEPGTAFFWAICCVYNREENYRFVAQSVQDQYQRIRIGSLAGFDKKRLREERVVILPDEEEVEAPITLREDTPCTRNSSTMEPGTYMSRPA